MRARRHLFRRRQRADTSPPAGVRRRRQLAGAAGLPCRGTDSIHRRLRCLPSHLGRAAAFHRHTRLPSSTATGASSTLCSASCLPPPRIPAPSASSRKNNLLRTSRYRTPADKHSHPSPSSPLSSPSIPSASCPLHSISSSASAIASSSTHSASCWARSVCEAALKRITTVHSAGCGGKSDLYDLNGPEISKWIKKECSKGLLAAVAPSSGLADTLAAPAAASAPTSPAARPADSRR